MTEHCPDHTGLDAKIAGLDKKLDDKFTVQFWIQGGLGAVLLAILITLIVSLSQYNSLSIRVASLEEDIKDLKNFNIKTHPVRIEGVYK